MRAHLFESTGEAYDATQCDDDVKTGDVLIIASEKVIGIAYTWPIAVTKEHGKLHCPIDGEDVAMFRATFDTYREENRDALLLGMDEAVKLAKELGW
jgi:hypothetical protein